MKIKSALLYAFPALIVGALSIHQAQALSINVDFDLNNGTVFVNPNANYSSNAISLGGPVQLDPFDTLDVWIQFVDQTTGAKQHLQIFDLGDPLDETFGVSANGSGIANGAPYFGVEFSGVQGDVIGTMFSSSVGDCFSGTTCVSSTFSNDLTDTSFLLHDIHISLALPDGQSMPATIDSVQFGFALDNNTTAFEIGVWPVPEPGMLALFGLGLVGLGLARRRRNGAG